MKHYQAYSNDGLSVTAQTPSDALVRFFDKYPKKRKCNVIEGFHDGESFTVSYGRASHGEWPQSWKDLTRKDIGPLIGFVKNLSNQAGR